MNKNLNKLIIFVIIALVLAVLSQYLWVRKTYRVFSANQKELITLSVSKSVDHFIKCVSDIRSTSDSSFSYDFHEEVDSIGELCFIEYENMFSEELANNNIDGDFYYAFRYKDKMLYKSNNKIPNSEYLDSDYIYNFHCDA